MYLRDGLASLLQNTEGSMRKLKIKYTGYREKLRPKGIRSTIVLAFSAVSVSVMLILGIVISLAYFPDSTTPQAST